MSASLNSQEVEVDGLRIQLRQREFAAFLAWLLPGSGHFYQGRKGKGALYSSTVLSLFIIGMVLSGGKAIYWSWTAEDWRLQYICQFGMGLPALPALAQAYIDPNGTKRHPDPDLRNFQKKPANTALLDEWHRATSSGFDLGTLYTMVAGLLNILIVFDAYAGPLPMPGNDQRKKNQPDKNDSASPSET